MSIRTVIGIDADIAAKARRCRTREEVVRAALNHGRQQQRIDSALTARDRDGTLDGTMSLAEHRAQLTTESETFIAALVKRVAEVKN
jgi:hypothetical protein